MSRPLLVTFLGFPGSGKTYFSVRLAKALPAVPLNSDALRLSMFGSLEHIEQIRATDTSRLYSDVFGAMDYATKQILLSGESVIYDAQMTKRDNRKNIEKIAKSCDALAILVWVKTNPDEALRRGQEREVRSDSMRYSEEKMRMLIERFDRVTDLPAPEENLIVINGEDEFELQYLHFQQGVKDIVGV